MRRVFAQGNIAKYILLSPASAVYALFVLNTKESKNQYRESHYGSTFEAVLYLQRNRPPSKFTNRGCAIDVTRPCVQANFHIE